MPSIIYFTNTGVHNHETLYLWDELLTYRLIEYNYLFKPKGLKNMDLWQSKPHFNGYTKFLFQFQSSDFIDVTLLDVNTLFVTEIIQESLYRDGFSSAHIMEPAEDIFEEDDIRDNHNGIMNYKAPALFRMMRLILGDESTDFIQLAGRALVTGRCVFI